MRPLLCRLPLMRVPVVLLFSLAALPLFAQEAEVFGTVTDTLGAPVPEANVFLDGSRSGTSTDRGGNYSLRVPAGSPIRLRIGHASFDQQVFRLTLADGERRRLDVALITSTLTVVDITAPRRGDGVEPLDPVNTKWIPTFGGGVEGLLQKGGGVTIRNEFSSGYSVRGGNFDENLVYVNDIEVYRPFLARAGQQEGLSFPNPDLIERINFSAGGFDARYGDKLSSVLDIQYKRPREFKGSLSAGLLGGTLHLESPMVHGRLRQVTGFRYRTLTTILQGTDTKGEYDPRYTDLQSYWTYDLSDKVEIGFLGVYSRNRYNRKPENRETEFGPFNQALRFTVFFEGQERTAFETMFGALNLNWKARKDLLLKFTASAFNTHETERFDILGQYFLSELDRDLGSDQFGEVVRDLGVGTFLDHARNQLDANVYTVAHKGFRYRANGTFQWGLDARMESIRDRISEWSMNDSADFSTPQSAGEDLTLDHTLKSKLELESVRASGYVQNNWKWNAGRDSSARWNASAGIRAQYWSANGQTVVSPRARISWEPGWTKQRTMKVDGRDTILTVDRDYRFWFATGLYYQPPFYRELRNFEGRLNTDLKAQQSIHFVLGMDRLFEIWDRPFKFSAETYYKAMDDLVPYEVDNVRIRYYAQNLARGYAAGADIKLNGEFIKGIESWASLGVLSTFEDLKNDFYYLRLNAAGDTIIPGFTADQVAVDSIRKEPGYIPRPTDQRVGFALFFQDEMPRYPTFKVHMNLVFGTSLPYGPPNDQRYPDTLRTGLYRRVDIGFSKQFLGAEGQKNNGWAKRIESLWLSVEIFNLLNINNTVDRQWVQDAAGRYYAIPEYLSPRRLNVKLIAWF